MSAASASSLFTHEASRSTEKVGSDPRPLLRLTESFLFFATIELIATVVLLGVAWRWRAEPAPASSELTGGESA